MSRRFIYTLTGLLSVFACAIGVSIPASAAPIQYIWNGNEQIIGIGGPLEQMKYSKQKKDNDATGVTFKLDREGEGGVYYKAGNLRIGNKDATDPLDVRKGDASVDSDSLFEDIFSTVYGTTPKQVQCFITSMSLVYSPSENKIVDVIVHEAAMEADGGNWIAKAATAANNMLNTCKKTFNGAFLTGKLKAADRTDNMFTATVESRQGHNPIYYRFNKQLGIMFNREINRYQHRVCGIPKAKPECIEPTRNIYRKIWLECRYNSYNSGELSEASEGINDSEEGGRAPAKKFAACIKEKSGLGINENLLEHNTAVDIVSYGDRSGCTIPSIGYIICPLSRFLAKVVDNTFQAFSVYFKVTPLDRGTPAGDALHKVWALMRNIANAIFILIFLLVIAAQVSNFGISNYGVKRMLPKLIVTALIINASYILCTFAVDVANILGNTLRNVMELMVPNAPLKLDFAAQSDAANNWSNTTNSIVAHTALVGSVGLVALTASIVGLIPLLVGAAIAVITAMILILIRYVAILGLVAIAPLAIACSLLPGTKSWYKRWLSMFTSMLMLYPLISLIVGASTLASVIVMNSSLTRETGGVTLVLFGLAIQFLPLALTPLMLKFGGTEFGKIANKVQNNKGFGAAKNKAGEVRQRRKNARDFKALQHSGANRRGGVRGLRDRMIQRKYLKKGVRTMRQGELDRSRNQYLADYVSGKDGSGGDKVSLLERAKQAGSKAVPGYNYQAKNKGTKLANKMAAGGGSAADVLNSFQKASVKFDTDVVEAHKAGMRSQMRQSGSLDNTLNQATDPAADVAIRQAAIEIVKESGTQQDISQLVKSSNTMTPTQRATTAQAAATSSPLYSAPEMQNAILSGNMSPATHDQHIASVINSGQLSAEDYGAFDSHTLSEIERSLPLADASATQAARSSAQAAHTSPSSNARMDDASRAALDRFARGPNNTP